MVRAILAIARAARKTASLTEPRRRLPLTRRILQVPSCNALTSLDCRCHDGITTSLKSTMRVRHAALLRARLGCTSFFRVRRHRSGRRGAEAVGPTASSESSTVGVARIRSDALKMSSFVSTDLSREFLRASKDLP